MKGKFRTKFFSSPVFFTHRLFGNTILRMANNRTRSRGWTFTANLPEGEYDILEKGFGADYMVWQYEMVTRLHIQGYVYFTNARSMKVVKRDIKDWCGVDAHMEKTRGTPEHNKTYCTKEESRVHGPYEEGVRRRP